MKDVQNYNVKGSKLITVVTSEINGDNLNIVRREDIRYFRNRKREYLKDKMSELAMNSKNKKH
jgi:hypothetical protein